MSVLHYSQLKTLSEVGPLPLFFYNYHSKGKVRRSIALGLSEFSSNMLFVTSDYVNYINLLTMIMGVKKGNHMPRKKIQILYNMHNHPEKNGNSSNFLFQPGLSGDVFLF